MIDNEIIKSKVNVDNDRHNVLAINTNVLHERVVPVSSSTNKATRGEVSKPLKRKMRLLPVLYVSSFAVGFSSDVDTLPNSSLHQKKELQYFEDSERIIQDG